MPIKGKVGAVYALKTAPVSFDEEPAEMEQVGGIFLWEVDVEQIFNRSFAGDVPELHCVTTGWNAIAEAYWGDKRFFANKGEIVFIRFFIRPGSSRVCLQGYAVLPGDLEGEAGKINESAIYFEGIGRLKIGGE